MGGIGFAFKDIHKYKGFVVTDIDYHGAAYNCQLGRYRQVADT
jgi:hypothetical protein